MFKGTVEVDVIRYQRSHCFACGHCLHDKVRKCDFATFDVKDTQQDKKKDLFMFTYIYLCLKKAHTYISHTFSVVMHNYNCILRRR